MLINFNVREGVWLFDIDSSMFLNCYLLEAKDKKFTCLASQESLNGVDNTCQVLTTNNQLPKNSISRTFEQNNSSLPCAKLELVLCRENSFEIISTYRWYYTGILFQISQMLGR